MKKFFYGITLLVLLVLGTTFTMENPQEVSIRYYLGINWHGPLVIVILASLAIGLLIGSLSCLMRNFKLKRVNSRLQKENNLSSRR